MSELSDYRRCVSDPLEAKTPSESRTGESLKPCPFCGARLVSSVFNGRVHKFWDHLYSGEPLCPAAARRVDVTDPDHVAAWNRRSPPPAGEGGEALREDRDSWRRVAERLQGELTAALLADTGEGGKWLRKAAHEAVRTLHSLAASLPPGRGGDLALGAADCLLTALTAAQPLRSGEGS